MRKNQYRILLVDDDEISNFLTITNLRFEYKAADIYAVLNGMEAIEYLQKHTENLPDLIFLDINMPLLNGFEFLAWYETSDFKGRVKICMLSTSIRAEDQEKANGFSDVVTYLEKPLKHEAISTLLESL